MYNLGIFTGIGKYVYIYLNTKVFYFQKRSFINSKRIVRSIKSKNALDRYIPIDFNAGIFRVV